jgi:uncharacterized protein YacL
MMCFNHHNKNSVGICKHCGRGLCEACVSPLQESLACKDRCENHVRRLEQFVNKAVLSRYNTTFVGSMLVGLLMAVLGFFVSSSEYPSSPYDMILWIFAGLFFLNALRYLGQKNGPK